MQAAHLLKKLVDKFYKDLKIILTIKSVTLSTDSTITLSWIKISHNHFSRKELTKFPGVIEHFNMASYLNIGQLSRFDLRGCLILELSGFRFWFNGPKFSWRDFDFDNIGVQRLDDPGCSMDALLSSNKVCLLVQENSKADLRFMRLEKYCSCIRLISITALVYVLLKT